MAAFEKAFGLLEHSPFSCHKAWPRDQPLLRELVIPFGSSKYVALFEIDDARTVSILAVRHQRAEDYHYYCKKWLGISAHTDAPTTLRYRARIRSQPAWPVT